MGGEPAKTIVLDNPSQGVEFTKMKRRREVLKQHLHSDRWQWTIIGLVILDAILVGSDIILVTVYCSEGDPPKLVKNIEKSLLIGSIAILSFFVVEWWVEAWVEGFRRRSRSHIHTIDLFIVIVSLILEIFALAAKVSASSVGGLLVLFRLWRVVRVMHAVKEVQHKAAHEKVQELNEAKRQLESMADAHHNVVRALHKDFVRRLATKRVVSMQQDTASGAQEGVGEAEGSPDASVVNMVRTPSPSLPPPPSLDDMLEHVAKQSPLMRKSVTLYRKSAVTAAQRKSLEAAQRKSLEASQASKRSPVMQLSGLSRHSVAVIPSEEMAAQGKPGGRKEGGKLHRKSMVDGVSYNAGVESEGLHDDQPLREVCLNFDSSANMRHVDEATASDTDAELQQVPEERGGEFSD